MAVYFKDASSCWKAILADIAKNRGLLSEIERFAKENAASAQASAAADG